MHFYDEPNIQTTVDSKHNLVVDVKAVNTKNDRKMASVMGCRARAFVNVSAFAYLSGNQTSISIGTVNETFP